MTKPKPITLDSPELFVGFPTAINGVAMVFCDVDTGQEVRVITTGVGALAIAELLTEHGMEYVRRQSEAVKRYQENTASVAVERDCPPHLDS